MTRFATFRSEFVHNCSRLVADRSGATAVEYGLMVALISLGIMSTIVGVGNGLKTTLYGSIVSALQSMGNK
jgi:Flp pilus assembly pilin Flp